MQKSRKAKPTNDHTFPNLINFMYISLSYYKTIEKYSKEIPQKSFIPKQQYLSSIRGCQLLTKKIDKILTLLQDGQWHQITEITQKTKLNQTKVQLITNFLRKYNLIKLNKTQQEAKLTPPTHKFIKRIQENQ